jgi:hypothetical protein
MRVMTIFLVQSGSANFGSAREAMKSPLALKLFQVDGVTGVFFGSDFITVTKSDQYAWSLLKPEIFAAIMEHFTAGTGTVPGQGYPKSTPCIVDRNLDVGHSVEHHEQCCVCGYQGNQSSRMQAVALLLLIRPSMMTTQRLLQ